MKTDEIRERFEQATFDYDSLIPCLISYYHEQQRLMLDLIGASSRLKQQYERLWCQYMRSQGENDQKHFAGYLRQDQIQWLKKAGFEDISCHWRYLNFAIFGGQKPSS